MDLTTETTQSTKRSKAWVREGMIRLGTLMVRSREFRGWNLRECSEYILDKTGVSVQLRTIMLMEKGALFPQWNTFCAIAESQYIKGSGKVLTLEELMDVASGVYSYIFKPQIMDKHIRDCIAELVDEHCAKNDLTHPGFAKLYGIASLELEGLLKGWEIEDLEGVLILVSSALVNPRTKKRFRSCQELLDFCKLHR